MLISTLGPLNRLIQSGMSIGSCNESIFQYFVLFITLTSIYMGRCLTNIFIHGQLYIILSLLSGKIILLYFTSLISRK